LKESEVEEFVMGGKPKPEMKNIVQKRISNKKSRPAAEKAAGKGAQARDRRSKGGASIPFRVFIDSDTQRDTKTYGGLLLS